MGKHDITDKQKIFKDQIGQKATVDRVNLGHDKTEKVNRMLCDLGLAVVELDPALQHYTYFGSAAVHIYATQVVNSQIYLPQVYPLALYKCPMSMANAALQELDRKTREVYGMTKGHLRSGF